MHSDPVANEVPTFVGGEPIDVVLTGIQGGLKHARNATGAEFGNVLGEVVRRHAFG